MDALERSADSPPSVATMTSKAIGDLDDLLQAIVRATPEAKPWQRQLLTHLREADRQVQVLRMTISMQRDGSEVTDAVEAVRRTLRVANTYVAMGRADMATKAAVRLALELSQKLALRDEVGSHSG